MQNQMTNKLFHQILTALCVSLILTLSIRYNSTLNKNISTIEDQLRKSDDTRRLELQFSDFTYDSTIQLQEISGKKISINEILSSEYLVLRWTELSCAECLIQEFENIRGFADVIDNSHVCILTSNTSSEYLARIKRTQCRDWKLYNIKEYLLPVDSLGLPYYFLATPNHKISKLFFPDPANPALSIWYINMIIRRSSLGIQ